MTIRCAVAASRGEALGSLLAAIAWSMACTGRATWGLGAGSRTRKDLRRWVKGRAKSVPAPARRGSGHPSSTKACATFQRSGLQLACLSQSIQYKSGRQIPRVAGCGLRGSCRAATDLAVPQSVQYCCHQRQLVARAALSNVALSSAARAVSKSHWRAARAVGWHAAKISPVRGTSYQSA